MSVMSLYGNITQHIPRTNFKIKAVYPSRLQMALDEKKYWAYKRHETDPEYVKEYLHEINVNEYVMVDYTFKSDKFKDSYDTNKSVDSNNKNSFAYADDGVSPAEDYPADLIGFGGTFAPGNYHATIWQKQITAEDRTPSYVAIARLHSILPTFETWGSYEIDILEPLSSYPDAFGAGKEWWYPPKPVE